MPQNHIRYVIGIDTYLYISAYIEIKGADVFPANVQCLRFVKTLLESGNRSVTPFLLAMFTPLPSSQRTGFAPFFEPASAIQGPDGA
jgi:hypothetical protein